MKYHQEDEIVHVDDLVLVVVMKKNHTEIEQAMEDHLDDHHMERRSHTVIGSHMETGSLQDLLDPHHHHQGQEQDHRMVLVPRPAIRATARADEVQTLNHDILQRENIAHSNLEISHACMGFFFNLLVKKPQNNKSYPLYTWLLQGHMKKTIVPKWDKRNPIPYIQEAFITSPRSGRTIAISALILMLFKQVVVRIIYGSQLQ